MPEIVLWIWLGILIVGLIGIIIAFIEHGWDWEVHTLDTPWYERLVKWLLGIKDKGGKK